MHHFTIDFLNLHSQASGEQEDIDRAVNTIHLAINDLDQALLASMSDRLKPAINDSIKVKFFGLISNMFQLYKTKENEDDFVIQ